MPVSHPEGTSVTPRRRKLPGPQLCWPVLVRVSASSCSGARVVSGQGSGVDLIRPEPVTDHVCHGKICYRQPLVLARHVGPGFRGEHARPLIMNPAADGWR